MKSARKVPASPIPKPDLGKARVQFDLSRKEFLSLLKCVSLGETMANGYRVDDVIQEYRGIEPIALEIAEREGFHDLVEREADSRRLFPTRKLDEMVSDETDAFEEASFWEEAANRLVVRDTVRKLGENKIRRMGRERFALEMLRRANEYHSEFEKFGVDRLEIIDHPEGRTGS